MTVSNGTTMRVILLPAVMVALVVGAGWLGCSWHRQEVAENETAPMQLVTERSDRPEKATQTPPPLDGPEIVLADLSIARQNQAYLTDAGAMHGPTRVPDRRDAKDVYVPPQGDEPGYRNLRWVLSEDGFVGLYLLLRERAVRRAVHEVRPTHVALLVRADHPGAAFHLELWSDGRKYFTQVAGIGQHWRRLKLALEDLRDDNGDSLEAADLQRLERIAVVLNDSRTRDEGELHLSRISLVDARRWDEPPLPDGAAEPAALTHDAPQEPPTANDPPEPATPEPAGRAEGLVLFDFSNGADRADQFGTSWGSWQADGGSRTSTRDAQVNTPPGYLRLTYDVPEKYAGHFFKIDGRRLAAAADRPHTHLLLRWRGAECSTRFKLELKQGETCATYYDARRHPERALTDQFRDALIPLDEFTGFRPERLADLSELTTVFEADRITRSSGTLEIQRIALVRRDP